MTSRLAILCVLLLAGCSHRASDDERLTQLVAEHAAAQMRLDPYRAAEFGIEEGLDRFGDYPSPTYYERVRQLYRRTRDALKDVDASRLSPGKRLEYRL